LTKAEIQRNTNNKLDNGEKCWEGAKTIYINSSSGQEENRDVRITVKERNDPRHARYVYTEPKKFERNVRESPEKEIDVQRIRCDETELGIWRIKCAKL